jgi:DnaJ like chaperone protein
VSRYGSWIGGAIGWAFYGPIGAIMGFAFGKMFADSSLAQNEAGTAAGSRNRQSTQAGDFSIALLVLSAAVMKADDRILQSELDYVKGFLRKNFGEAKGAQLTLLLRDVLKQSIGIREVTIQIKQNMDVAKRRLLLQYLFGIAQADGEIHPAERDLIQQISHWMGISNADFKSIQEMFVGSTTDPYTVLEVERSATDSEIKKSYRKLVVKFHPDKTQDLGEDYRRQSRERFLAIQEAYEQIKRDRGIK